MILDYPGAGVWAWVGWVRSMVTVLSEVQLGRALVFLWALGSSILSSCDQSRLPSCGSRSVTHIMAACLHNQHGRDFRGRMDITISYSITHTHPVIAVMPCQLSKSWGSLKPKGRGLPTEWIMKDRDHGPDHLITTPELGQGCHFSFLLSVYSV